MNYHTEWWTMVAILLVLAWVVMPLLAVALSRAVTPKPIPMSRPVTPEPGPLDVATERPREFLWRWLGRALWAAAGQLSGRRRRRAQRWSGSCTRRAAMLEHRRQRREAARAVRAAQDERWARTLASSISSPVSRSMSAPMTPAEDEHTTRWSPPGRRYPFAPAPATPYRQQANVDPKYPPKARHAVRPPPPIPSMHRGPRRPAQ